MLTKSKQKFVEQLPGTCKFWGIALPLLLIYIGPIFFKAYREIPVYEQDCAIAPTVSGTPVFSAPCYQETAIATLTNHYDVRGRHNYQDISFDFPDGKTAFMQIDGNPGIWKTETEVNGVCTVECWHGTITAMFKSGTKILSKENPELKGNIVFGLLILFLTMSTIGCWLYLLLSGQRRTQ